MGVACRNCGTALAGEYCHACGQRDLPPDPTLRDLVGEAWGEFVSVDGKVLHSLRLLVLRPGQLTLEYLRGHRVRYLAPLRLYLVCSVAYFLVTSLVPERATTRTLTVGKDTIVVASVGPSADEPAARKLRRDSTTRAVLARHRLAVPAAIDSATRALADSLRIEDQVESLTAAPRWIRARMAHGIHGVVRDQHSYWQKFTGQLPRLLFVLMPVFALLLGIAYRSRRRRYPVHLIVALHVHAFVFAVLTLNEVKSLLPWGALRGALGWVTFAWLVAHLPLAMRRVYGGRMRYAVLRAGALAFTYSLIGGVAFSLMAFGLLLVY